MAFNINCLMINQMALLVMRSELKTSEKDKS